MTRCTYSVSYFFKYVYFDNTYFTYYFYRMFIKNNFKNNKK